MQADVIPDISDELRKALAVAHSLAAQGELTAAATAAEVVLERARTAANEEFQSRAHRKLAHIAVLTGAYHSSEQHLLDALAIARRRKLHDEACLCYYAFSRHLQLAGRLAQAEAELGEALVHAQRAQKPGLEGMVYLESGVCKQWLGEHDDQLLYSETAIGLFRSVSDSDLLFFALTLAADAADHLGKRQQAERYLAQAAEMTGIDGYANVMCGSYSEACLRSSSAGDRLGAADYLRRAEQLSGAQDDFDTVILLEMSRARVTTDAAAGAAALERALRLAQEHQSRCHIALLRLELAPRLLELGRTAEARAALLDAEQTFELNGMQRSLGRCHCAWARYYAACGLSSAVRSAQDRARSIAGRCQPVLGLHFAGDLDRLDQQLAAG